MAKFKNLLEKEELEHIKEVKEDIKEENAEKKKSSKEASITKEFTGKTPVTEGLSEVATGNKKASSQNGFPKEENSVQEKPSANISLDENSGKKKTSNTWIWVAAILAAIVIFK